MKNVKYNLATDLVLGFEISSMPGEGFILAKPSYLSSGSTRTESAVHFLSLMDNSVMTTDAARIPNAMCTMMPDLELWLLQYRGRAIAYLMVGSERESAFEMVAMALDDCILIQQGRTRSPQRAMSHKFVELDVQHLRTMAQSVAGVQVNAPSTPVLLMCPNIEDLHPWLIAGGHTDLMSDFMLPGYELHPDLPSVTEQPEVVYH